MTEWLILVACIAFCSAFVVVCCKRAPIEEYDQEEIDRINRIIATAAHHREQLEALALELIQAHGYECGTDEADDLWRVIYDGEDYDEALKRIVRRGMRA